MTCEPIGAPMWVLVATGAWPRSTGAWPTTAGAVKIGAGARSGAGRSAGAGNGACKRGAAGANRWLALATETAMTTVRATKKDCEDVHRGVGLVSL